MVVMVEDREDNVGYGYQGGQEPHQHDGQNCLLV